MKLRLSSSRLGTPMYKPPEFCGLGQDQYTEAVDLWGIGCILYVLMVGKDPFSLDDDLA